MKQPGRDISPFLCPYHVSLSFPSVLHSQGHILRAAGQLVCGAQQMTVVTFCNIICNACIIHVCIDMSFACLPTCTRYLNSQYAQMLTGYTNTCMHTYLISYAYICTLMLTNK